MLPRGSLELSFTTNLHILWLTGTLQQAMNLIAIIKTLRTSYTSRGKCFDQSQYKNISRLVK